MFNKKQETANLIVLKHGKAHQINYWLLYTLAFSVLAIFMHIIFVLNDKTFIWKTDGMYSYAVIIKYMQNCIHNIFNNLFSLEKINFSMFDFTFGQGFDIFQLGKPQFTDPVQWLAVLISPFDTERAYELVILLKMYLTGAFFSIFCFSRDKYSRLLILSGAIAYVFFGFNLILLQHPILMGQALNYTLKTGRIGYLSGLRFYQQLRIIIHFIWQLSF